MVQRWIAFSEDDAKKFLQEALNIRRRSRIFVNALSRLAEATAGQGTMRSTLSSNKFARIQDSFRIERLFEPTMKVTRHLARCFRPPSFFRQTDSVFACDHAAPRQHLLKEIVKRALDLFTHSSVAIVAACHDVDVNVAVPGVAEAGDRKSVLHLKLLCEFH